MINDFHSRLVLQKEYQLIYNLPLDSSQDSVVILVCFVWRERRLKIPPNANVIFM